MPSCVVKSCKNYIRKLKKLQGITYHAFPRNSIIKDEWIQIIRNCRDDDNWNPSSCSTICSAHFDDADFKTTAKGLRRLFRYAVPKKLLKLPEMPTQTKPSLPIILQESPNFRGVAKAKDQQLLSSQNMKPSLVEIKVEPLSPPQGTTPALVETIAEESQNFGGVASQSTKPSLVEIKLEAPVPPVSIEYCRLCAATDYDGKLVNLQNDHVMKKLVEKMSKRLNTSIDFNQEHLPTTVCSACIKALYTAYDFVVGIDLAQVTLNNRLMQKYSDEVPENENVDIKPDLSSISLQQVSTYNGDFDQLPLSVPSSTFTNLPKVSSSFEVVNTDFEQPLSSTNFSLIQVSPNSRPATSEDERPELPYSTVSLNLRLKYKLDHKKKLIEGQKKNLKRLNQRVRRLQKRNESLKNVLKVFKEKYNSRSQE